MDQTEIENLPYRQGVNTFVIDKNNNFLIVQKNGYDMHQWDVPGGGLEGSENLETAILREIQEELGTNKFKILGKSSKIYKYNWPEKQITSYFAEHGEKFRGQEKHQYLILFTGAKNEISKQTEELRVIKWVSYKQLKEHFIFENQWEVAKKTIADFVQQGILKL